jgi:hypothetical protein
MLTPSNPLDANDVAAAAKIASRVDVAGSRFFERAITN